MESWERLTTGNAESYTCHPIDMVVHGPCGEPGGVSGEPGDATPPCLS